MAILSATAISKAKDGPAGFRKRVERNIAFGTGYPTGGEPIPASTFGLRFITMPSAPRLNAGFSASFAHCDAIRQADGSLKLRLRAAAGTEVPNATDCTGVTALVCVEGW